MVKQPNSQTVHAKTPSKRDLQHQIGKTRESLGDTGRGNQGNSRARLYSGKRDCLGSPWLSRGVSKGAGRLEPWRTLSGIRSRLHARLRSQELQARKKITDRAVCWSRRWWALHRRPEPNNSWVELKNQAVLRIRFLELLTDMRGDNRDVGSILEREL